MTQVANGKILVPIDFTDASLDALMVAHDLANDTSDVVAVHVAAGPERHEHDLLATAIDHAKRRNHIADVLRTYIEDALPDSTSISADIDVRFGDPGSEIAASAERKHASLIVMPSHGRTGVRRLLLGSVAERVLRMAPCPVLILRDKEE